MATKKKSGYGAVKSGKTMPMGGKMPMTGKMPMGGKAKGTSGTKSYPKWLRLAR